MCVVSPSGYSTYGNFWPIEIDDKKPGGLPIDNCRIFHRYQRVLPPGFLTGHREGIDSLEVPIPFFQVYFSGLCKVIYPQNMAKNMVRLRTSICWILE